MARSEFPAALLKLGKDYRLGCCCGQVTPNLTPPARWPTLEKTMPRSFLHDFCDYRGVSSSSLSLQIKKGLLTHLSGKAQREMHVDQDVKEPSKPGKNT